MELIPSSIKAWIIQYALAILAAVAVAGWAVAGLQTLRFAWLQSSTARAETNRIAADIAASEKARQREQEWGLIVREIDDAKQTAMQSVSAERDAALASLRNRAPSRMPSAATASCAGASPAQLSRPDAEVAIWIGSDADELRANYAACKSYVERIGR